MNRKSLGKLEKRGKCSSARVRVAADVKEACELVEAEFEHVTGEYSGGKLFRKRK